MGKPRTITDKERLDWFEKHEPSVYRNIGDFAYSIVVLDVVKGNGATFRVALDRAIRAERKGDR